MRISKQQVLWLGLTLLLPLVGCERAHRAARRRAHPQDYAALSGEEKTAVDRGALRQGMNTNAVLIAWGAPTLVSTMSTPSGPYVIWEYYRKRVAGEQTVRREVIVPWSPTPVPESRLYPTTPPPTPPVVEYLERTAVFHEDRLVNWSPK